MRVGAMACSSRASSMSVAVETYFFGTSSATVIAVTIAAAKTMTNALRRARSASMNWWKSMFVFLPLSLKERFFDVDHVVGLDLVAQLRVGLHHLAVVAGATHLQPAVAAA